jgi:hypothetical protein
MSTSQRTGRDFRRLGLLFAAIPLLAGVHHAYELASRDLEQQAHSWLTTFVSQLIPRLGFTLILALAVYGLFQAIGRVIVRLDHVSSAAQAARRLTTSAYSAR